MPYLGNVGQALARAWPLVGAQCLRPWAPCPLTSLPDLKPPRCFRWMCSQKRSVAMPDPSALAFLTFWVRGFFVVGLSNAHRMFRSKTDLYHQMPATFPHFLPSQLTKCHQTLPSVPLESKLAPWMNQWSEAKGRLKKQWS